MFDRRAKEVERAERKSRSLVPESKHGDEDKSGECDERGVEVIREKTKTK